MKMIQEDLAEWCEALESRKYPQGKGNLESGGLFSCLGVLCKLQANKGNVYRLPGSRIGDAVTYSDISLTHSAYYLAINAICLTVKLSNKFSCSLRGFSLHHKDLPEDVQETVDSFLEISPRSSRMYTLVDLNDAGVKFPKLAKLIRKHVQVIKEYPVCK